MAADASRAWEIQPGGEGCGGGHGPWAFSSGVGSEGRNSPGQKAPVLGGQARVPRPGESSFFPSWVGAPRTSSSHSPPCCGRVSLSGREREQAPGSFRAGGGRQEEGVPAEEGRPGPDASSRERERGQGSEPASAQRLGAGRWAPARSGLTPEPRLPPPGERFNEAHSCNITERALTMLITQSLARTFSTH